MGAKLSLCQSTKKGRLDPDNFGFTHHCHPVLRHGVRLFFWRQLKEEAKSRVAHGETVRSNVLPLPLGERVLIFCCPTFGESDYILEMDGSTDFCVKTQHTAQKRVCVKMEHKETDFLSITRYLCHLCKDSLHFFALRRLVL